MVKCGDKVEIKRRDKVEIKSRNKVEIKQKYGCGEDLGETCKPAKQLTAFWKST